MDYRIGHKKPKEPNRSINNINTPSKINITNGTTFNAAYVCRYKLFRKPERVKNKEVLNEITFNRKHSGRPYPNIKRYFDMSNTLPIHLNDEYTFTKDGITYTPSAEIVFKGDLAGLSQISCTIDDNVIRVVIAANCPDCIEKPGKDLFTIRFKYPILQDDGTVSYRYTVAASGVVIVRPAVI